MTFADTFFLQHENDAEDNDKDSFDAGTYYLTGGNDSGHLSTASTIAMIQQY